MKRFRSTRTFLGELDVKGHVSRSISACDSCWAIHFLATIHSSDRFFLGHLWASSASVFVLAEDHVRRHTAGSRKLKQVRLEYVKHSIKAFVVTILATRSPETRVVGNKRLPSSASQKTIYNIRLLCSTLLCCDGFGMDGTRVHGVERLTLVLPEHLKPSFDHSVC